MCVNILTFAISVSATWVTLITKKQLKIINILFIIFTS